LTIVVPASIIARFANVVINCPRCKLSCPYSPQKTNKT